LFFRRLAPATSDAARTDGAARTPHGARPTTHRVTGCSRQLAAVQHAIALDIVLWAAEGMQGSVSSWMSRVDGEMNQRLISELKRAPPGGDAPLSGVAAPQRHRQQPGNAPRAGNDKGTAAPSELPSTSAVTVVSGDAAREDTLLDTLRRVELLGISAPPLDSPPDGSG
jgi:hypothetical protein